MKWNPRNKKYYEELGYVFTTYGDEFEVKVEDLAKGSMYKVQCICDNCLMLNKEREVYHD